MDAGVVAAAAALTRLERHFLDDGQHVDFNAESAAGLACPPPRT